MFWLLPDDGLVVEAETCCHLVTLNKINIHNTSCVLTCESLLLTLPNMPAVCVWASDMVILGRKQTIGMGFFFRSPGLRAMFGTKST